MNALTIDVRPAVQSDVEALAEVHHQAWIGAYTGIIPHRALRSMLDRRGAQWWKRVIDQSCSVLVIDMGGDVVGYATFGANRARQLPQQGEIYEIYLKPEYQGLGLGSRLFRAAKNALVRSGHQGLVVWSLEDNDIAVQFYGAQGGVDLAEGSERFDDKDLKKVAFVWN